MKLKKKAFLVHFMGCLNTTPPTINNYNATFSAQSVQKTDSVQMHGAVRHCQMN